MGQTRIVRIRYTLPALADLEEILDHIATHSPRGARRVQMVIDLLPRHPHIGTRANDPAIRRMTASPYPDLVFYEATDMEIIIHAVRHGAAATDVDAFRQGRSSTRPPRPVHGWPAVTNEQR